MKIIVTDFGKDVRVALQAESSAEECQITSLIDLLDQANTNYVDTHGGSLVLIVGNAV